MINKLIDLQFDVDNTSALEMGSGGFTIQQYVLSFLSGLGQTQKERFKKMLENGFEAGMSIAKNYGVDYNEFMKEVKKQLNIKEEN